MCKNKKAGILEFRRAGRPEGGEMNKKVREAMEGPKGRELEPCEWTVEYHPRLDVIRVECPEKGVNEDFIAENFFPRCEQNPWSRKECFRFPREVQESVWRLLKVGKAKSVTMWLWS